MLFIADAMLGSLARRLRLLGYDVLYDPTLSDNDILRLALEQERTILTRDTGLASRPLAGSPVLVKSDHVEEQVRQVVDAHPTPEGKPLTRCSVCNSLLTPLARSSAVDRVPGHVLLTTKVFFECKGCNRVYWEGSHVKNMAGMRVTK